MVTIEYALTHAEEVALRLNESERYVAKARPELDALRRDLRAAEATLEQARRERADLEARHKLEVARLQAEVAFARRPWHKRLFNAGAAT
jgi:predicted  nucleic acid-binding Zn-ribbon protein